MFRISNKLKIFLVFCIVTSCAFIFRVSYIENTIIDTPIRADAASYVAYAYNLSEHGVFSKNRSAEYPIPDSYRAPGYPIFLTAIIKTVESDNFYSSVLYTQAFLGALTAGIVVVLGALFLPLWGATIASILTVFSPHLVSLGGYLLTETLFTFFLIVSIFIFCFAHYKNNHFLYALSGLVFGVTYLVNPVIFFAPLLVAFIGLIVARRDIALHTHKIKKSLFLFLFCFMTVAGVWLIRGYVNVSGEEASSYDNALVNFIIGSHDDFFDIWRANPRDPQNPAAIDIENSDGSLFKFLLRLSKRISHEPGDYAKWYFLEKPYLLWSWNILIGQGDVYIYPIVTSLYKTSKIAIATYSISKSLHHWILIVALIGLLFLIRDYFENKSNIAVITLYVCTLYVSAVYVVLQSEPRYSIPLRPELYLCAIYGLLKIKCRISSLVSRP